MAIDLDPKDAARLCVLASGVVGAHATPLASGHILAHMRLVHPADDLVQKVSLTTFRRLLRSCRERIGEEGSAESAEGLFRVTHQGILEIFSIAPSDALSARVADVAPLNPWSTYTGFIYTFKKDCFEWNVDVDGETHELRVYMHSGINNLLVSMEDAAQVCFTPEDVLAEAERVRGQLAVRGGGPPPRRPPPPLGCRSSGPGGRGRTPPFSPTRRGGGRTCSRARTARARATLSSPASSSARSTRSR